MSITGIKYSFICLCCHNVGALKHWPYFMLFQLFWLSASFLNGVHLSSMKHLKDFFFKSAFTEIHIKATNVKEDSNIAAVVIHWLL